MQWESRSGRERLSGPVGHGGWGSSLLAVCASGPHGACQGNPAGDLVQVEGELLRELRGGCARVEWGLVKGVWVCGCGKIIARLRLGQILWEVLTPTPLTPHSCLQWKFREATSSCNVTPVPSAEKDESCVVFKGQMLKGIALFYHRAYIEQCIWS